MTDFYPFAHFENIYSSSIPYDIIVLNKSKKSLDKHMTPTVWSGAKTRLCADGGSNELYQFIHEKEERLYQYTPTNITGDLDSITKETRDFFENLNVSFNHIPEQDTTDFTKCLKLLQEKWGDQTPNKILVFCTFAGRFDQAIGIVHTLYLYPHLQIILVSEDDITFLLKSGMNRIYVASKLRGKYCSLIPFDGRARAITTGLQWNLDLSDALELNFHSLISTSNSYNECELAADGFATINTHVRLVWSMTFADWSSQTVFFSFFHIQSRYTRYVTESIDITRKAGAPN